MASRLSRKGLANFLVYFCVFVEGEGLWYNLLSYTRCVLVVRWVVGCPGKGYLNVLVYFCVFVEGEGLWYCLLPYARCVWGGGQ